MTLIDRRPAERFSAPDAQVVITQARARTRRRRRRAAIATVLAVGVAVAAVIAVRVVGTGARRAVAIAPPKPVVIETVRQPKLYLAHAADGAHGGVIEVIDSTTGHKIRTLGSAYEPYPRNGFQLSPDGKVLFYVRLNEPEQKIEIIRQPIDGGTPTVVTDGVRPELSADGTLLAYTPPRTSTGPVGSGPATPIAVRDLPDGSTHTFTPPVGSDRAGITTAWLSNSALLVIVSTPSAAQFCGVDVAPGATPKCPAITPAATSAFILDPRSGQWRSLPPLPARYWTGITAVLPGSSTTQVRAIITAVIVGPRRTDTIGGDAVISFDPTSGAVANREPLPAGRAYLGADRTGTHLLLATTDATESWIPGYATGPRALGPSWAEASWS